MPSASLLPQTQDSLPPRPVPRHRCCLVILYSSNSSQSTTELLVSRSSHQGVHTELAKPVAFSRPSKLLPGHTGRKTERAEGPGAERALPSLCGRDRLCSTSDWLSLNVPPTVLAVVTCLLVA
ncbi:hypothetical protein mRhiFer1_008337 [Rhinolophus ferrumequinum]|uniref:Uncharacterized protein n=1 Tax=Rhinolophus ferrumequinum TaxID=59479 RepID=A0A7J7VDZ4_RHIFE|nr:hypothetical protein mRhiFer1_008337 [Rhinolophus ferrumequinum]